MYGCLLNPFLGGLVSSDVWILRVKESGNLSQDIACKELIKGESIICGGLRVVKIELCVPWDYARRGLEGTSKVKERTVDLEVY